MVGCRTQLQQKTTKEMSDKKFGAASPSGGSASAAGTAFNFDMKSPPAGAAGGAGAGGAGGAVKKPPRPYTRIKVLSMGEGGVGKSCLIKRYCEEKFVSRYISTIGVDFGVRTVSISGYSDVKVNFWDLSGHPEFVDIRTEFYNDTQGCVLVYDVTSRKSFTGLEQWIKEATKHASASGSGGWKPYVTFLVANKIDLAKQRVVTEAEGRQWAQQKGFVYWESSACTGANVNDLFNSSQSVVFVPDHFSPAARS